MLLNRTATKRPRHISFISLNQTVWLLICSPDICKPSVDKFIYADKTFKTGFEEFEPQPLKLRHQKEQWEHARRVPSVKRSFGPSGLQFNPPLLA